MAVLALTPDSFSRDRSTSLFFICITPLPRLWNTSKISRSLIVVHLEVPLHVTVLLLASECDSLPLLKSFLSKCNPSLSCGFLTILAAVH